MGILPPPPVSPRRRWTRSPSSFTRMAPIRGVDYSLGGDLYHMVKAIGFSDPGIEIHQPAIYGRGETPLVPELERR